MPSIKRGLGEQGISVLLGESAGDGQPVNLIKLAHIEPNRDQPRKYFDDEALSGLVDSIKQKGIIQPLTLRRIDTDRYQIIAGERRWRASRLAGLSEVPAYILEADDMLMLELALVENLQREDLNPIEEAEGFKLLIERYGMTQERAAQSVSKSRPAVANVLRLLELPDEVKEMLRTGALSGGHARTLLPLGNKKAIVSTAKTVIDGALSVRATEKLVKSLLAQRTEPDKTQQPLKVDYARDLGTQLAKTLGRGVKIQQGRGKAGRVVLDYYDHDDLGRLIDFLTQYTHTTA